MRGSVQCCYFLVILSGVDYGVSVKPEWHKGEYQPSLNASSYDFDEGSLITFQCLKEKGRNATISLLDGKNKAEVPTYEIQYNVTLNQLTGEYRMDFNTNVTAICSVYNNSEVVAKSEKFLKYTGDKGSQFNPPITEANSNQLNSGDESDNDKGEKSTKNLMYYVGAGAGVAIFIIVMIFIIVKAVSACRRDNKKDSETCYENLTNETTPFPTNAKLETIYCTPIDSQASGNACSDNDTYALPYVPKAEDVEGLYTKPIPKSQRNKPYTLYSTVLPKSMRKKDAMPDVTYAEITLPESSGRHGHFSEEPTYAAIGNLEPHSESNYANEFNNQPYVNAKDARRNDEYAVPTYCEINKVSQ